MKPTYLSLAILLGWFGSATHPAAARSDMAAYAKIEVADLRANPGNWWARAISFSDKIESPPSGRAIKLGNGVRHRSMKLAGAGEVWVPANLTRSFMNLDPDREYCFAGTVNQTDDNFHVVVDACFLRTEEGGRENWADAFAPQSDVVPAAEPANASSVRIEAKLLDGDEGVGVAVVVLPPGVDAPPPTAEPSVQTDAPGEKATEKQARVEAKRRAKEEVQAAKAAARAREETESKANAAAAEQKAEAERQAKLEAKQKKAAEKQARLEAKRRAAEEAQAAAQAEKAEAQAEEAAKAEARRIAEDQQAKLEAKEKKAAEKQARLEAERRAEEEALAAKAAAQAERERQKAEARARE